MDAETLDRLTAERCKVLPLKQQIKTGYKTQGQLERSFSNLNKYSINPMSDVKITFSETLPLHVGYENALWENTQKLEALSLEKRVESVGVSPARAEGSSVVATNIFYDESVLREPDAVIVEQLIKTTPEPKSPELQRLQELRETEQRVLIGQRDVAEAERDLMKYTKDQLLSFYKSRMADTPKSVKKELGLKPFSKYRGKTGDKAELIEDIAKLIGGDVEQVEAEMAVERAVQPAFEGISEEVSLLAMEEAEE